MRISYNILWVEDVTSWYKTNLELIEDYLGEYGFKVEPTHCRNFDEVKSEYDKNQLKEYDILFVDFQLAGSPDGDRIIDFIRSQDDNSILTDIIFYSSDIESVRDKLKENGFEGVYTSPRTDFTEKAEKVILSTIKKVQEVNSMRGLIMAETSDLDNLMLEITSKFLDSEHKEKLEKYIDEKITKTVNDNLKTVNSKNKNIIDKINKSYIFTSTHKAKCINKIFELTKNSNQVIGKEKFFKRYDEEVLFKRNLFAHVKESEINGEKVLVSHSNGRQITFNEAECIKIRKTLIEFREELESINNQL